LPPYALTGQPPPSTAPPERTPEEIAAMRHTGALAAEVLLEVSEKVAPGVTTDALDCFVHETIIGRNAYPSPLNYRGFPKSVCTSVNEVICHGIPDSRPLEDGDIINIDVTAYRDGVHGDTSAMFLVGEVEADSQMLVRETLVSLHKAIEVVRPGCRCLKSAEPSSSTPKNTSLEWCVNSLGMAWARNFMVCCKSRTTTTPEIPAC